jgi:UPF0755 protein
MRLALVIVAVLIVVGIVGAGLYFAHTPVMLDKTVAVVIESGQSTGEIAAILDEEGVLRSRRFFIWWAKLRGIDRHLQPGRYEFSGPTTMWEVMDSLRTGRVTTLRVTIPEGWILEEIAARVASELKVDSAAFMRLTRDPDVLKRWGVPADDMEGYLLPETYTFFYEVSAEAVINRLAEANYQIFTGAVARRMEEMDWTRHEVLTLASMVEAESGIRDERARIAAVFHNRLERGMLLQCDPTVIYGMGGLPPGRRLYRKDLDYESPYNTYLHAGLPPGPICNPGEAAILAVLYPGKSSELYFVADGRGGHIFSETLNEHNRARVQAKRNRRNR